MNTIEQTPPTHQEPTHIDPPKKRSKWRILLFIIWVAVVIAWFSVLANM